MQRKVSFGVIAVILALVLTAGTVTAAYFLHSTTTVEDNDIDSEFIVIGLSTYTDLLDEVSFDTTVTYNQATQTSTTAYDLNENADIWNPTANNNNGDYGTDGVNDACLISNPLTINVAQTNTDNLYYLDVTVSDFIPIAGLSYIMTVTSTQGTLYSDYLDNNHPNMWRFLDLQCGLDYAVALYVMGTPTENPGATVGFTNADPDARDANNQPAPIAGSIFTFLAVAPNGAGTIEP